MMYNIGTHLLKQIRKKLIINYALQEKHRHMIKRLNRQKYKDKQAHKWKNKAYLLIKELINLYSRACILIVKCGQKEETKQPFIFKD